MLTHMSPTWLAREFGEKMVLGLMGYTLDAHLEASTLALKAPWLLEDTSPDDAVSEQADETQIEQYPSETEASHRARVVTAFDAYEFAGTEDGHGDPGQGIEGQLILLGYPNAFTLADYEIDFDDESTSHVPPGVNWSRFWVFIPDTDHSWTDDGIWSDPGVWSDGGVWDTSASFDEIRNLRRVIKKWKAAHDLCPFIIILRGGELWDYPTGPWSDPGNWDDGDIPIFIPAF